MAPSAAFDFLADSFPAVHFHLFQAQVTYQEDHLEVEVAAAEPTSLLMVLFVVLLLSSSFCGEDACVFDVSCEGQTCENAFGGGYQLGK